MRILIAIASLLLFSAAFAADTPATDRPEGVHRYMIERTFKPGALAGLNDTAVQKIRANNASLGVRWLYSYANADKTKTYCLYEGPSEAAIRKAAQLNSLPVDSVMEVPVDLKPSPAKTEAVAAK